MREGWRQQIGTHRSEIQVFNHTVLLRSDLAILVQGHLKAKNHYTFSSLLFFRGSRIISRHRIILVSTRFSIFASLAQSNHKVSKYFSLSSLLYFRKSGIISRPQIVLVSTHFLTFLVFLRFFSNSQKLRHSGSRQVTKWNNYGLRLIVLLIKCFVARFTSRTQNGKKKGTYMRKWIEKSKERKKRKKEREIGYKEETNGKVKEEFLYSRSVWKWAPELKTEMYPQQIGNRFWLAGITKNTKARRDLG